MRARTFILIMLVAVLPAAAATIELRITPKVAGEDLQPASLRYRTSANEQFSITRVSYLLSDFALQREDGSWLEFSNSVAWFDHAQGREAFQLTNVPTGRFLSLRFNVGLRTNLNHTNIAQLPAGHALNPNMNGLNWSWQGGYIFLALEGLWRNARGELDGWAYHFARDENCTSVTLPAAIEVSNAVQVDIAFDLATLLNAPRPLSFGRDGSSTHSRSGDPIAKALRQNLPGAFQVRRVSAVTAAEIAATHPQPLFMPAQFTPYAFNMSAAFPMPQLPADNPLLTERVDLGRKLFMDPLLSVNNKQSCFDCHAAKRGFTDGRATAVGAEGAAGVRNTMPLFNLAWKNRFFWDGRAATIREQVLIPIENPLEMHESLPRVVEKLRSSASNYPKLFTAAFGSAEITAQKIGLALENYLLTLTSFDSKFDRALRGEEKLTAAEQRGFELFSTEYDPRRGQYGADCFHCHGGPLFQSQSFANNGLDEKFSDDGYGKITGRASDKGKFAVPSLRNVALTGPYMHDGRFKTLEEALDHYASGIKRSETLDPNLAKHPNGGVPLTPGDKQALIAFLKTLTDESLLNN